MKSAAVHIYLKLIIAIRGGTAGIIEKKISGFIADSITNSCTTCNPGKYATSIPHEIGKKTLTSGISPLTDPPQRKIGPDGRFSWVSGRAPLLQAAEARAEPC